MPPTQVPDVVVVHPLVLLSVVDHYNRVAKDTKNRVVGCLLGSTHKGQVDISNSFAVPFEEDDKDSSVWYLDHNFMENMFSMFRKVNSSERIVGWYSTGPKIRAADLTINELFRRYHSAPVFVVVDVCPKADHSIPTDAYCGVYKVNEDGSASESTFVHVPSEIGALEAEEIGVEHLLRDVKDTTVSMLSHRITSKLHSLHGLHQRLLEVQTYLSHVINRSMPPNHQILTSIQEMFNLLPSTHAVDMSRCFAVETNDMMLAIYLSSLVRSVIALHDLIANKQANKDAEKKMNEREAQARDKALKEAKDSKDSKEAVKDATKENKEGGSDSNSKNTP